MAATTSQLQRAWQGPAILTLGLRPFFLLGAIWAAVAMVLWILMLSGVAVLPLSMAPSAWHAHEFLFGYTGAIVAGFLLTAVPNWTGRLPVVGWPLAMLVALWLAGRVAMATSALWPHWVTALVDISFPLTLSAVLAREVTSGKNWKNVPILGLLALFTVAQVLFYTEGNGAQKGIGTRLALAGIIGMIMMIGGRIIPSFTRNWMVKQRLTRFPTPPMQRFDKAVLIFSIPAMFIWVAAPLHPVTGVTLAVMAVLHAVRLGRWSGWATRQDGLVFVLHIAYAMIPLGAAALALHSFAPQLLDQTSAQHVWMAGAIGLMTIGVMTRASLGHTGHALHADGWTIAIYGGLIGAVVARLFAPLFSGMAGYHLSAGLWIASFAVYSVRYGIYLLRPRLLKSR